MPIITQSSYKKRPWYLFNGYLETIVPHLTTKINQVVYEDERLELSDGDFLDLCWIKKGQKKLMIISHAIEGNAKDIFVEQTAKYFSKKGCDILVWHYRSCSKEMNRLPRFYHHGDIDDLDQVVKHGEKKGYKEIVLTGFSMGGNLMVNYLGSGKVSSFIKGGVAFSVPMDLEFVAKKLHIGFNRNLERIIINKWKKKIERKAIQYPELFDLSVIDKKMSLEEFHTKYTLKLHGFKSPEEYYTKWSSLQFLSKIKVPLLLVNAQNDPLLSKNCYPFEICERSKFVYLEAPKHGGHTGFTGIKDNKLWYIHRTESFIAERIEDLT